MEAHTLETTRAVTSQATQRVHVPSECIHRTRSRDIGTPSRPRFLPQARLKTNCLQPSRPSIKTVDNPYANTLVYAVLTMAHGSFQKSGPQIQTRNHRALIMRTPTTSNPQIYGVCAIQLLDPLGNKRLPYDASLKEAAEAKQSGAKSFPEGNLPLGFGKIAGATGKAGVLFKEPYRVGIRYV